MNTSCFSNLCRIKVLYVAEGSKALAYTKMLDSLSESLQEAGIYYTFTMVLRVVLTILLFQYHELIVDVPLIIGEHS